MDDLFKKTQVSAGPPADNEKLVYQYQVESLKDDFDELQENFSLLQKEHKDKARAHDLLKRDHTKLEKEHKLLQEILEQREKLIEENGLLLVGLDDSEPDSGVVNGDARGLSSKRPSINGHLAGGWKSITSGPVLITRDVAELIDAFEGASLSAKIKNLLDDRDEMAREIRRLRLDLEDERTRYDQFESRSMSEAGSESTLSKADESDTKKTILEYKFKLKKAEQEVIVLQGTVSRIETQLARYKLASEESEKLEDELKTEKRKILRDLREAQAKADELETANSHLQKRIDKMKNAKLQIINS
ncbi:Leucine-rich repeat flightless-interacting protein 2 [Halotydeus destructor]|nr:Leucine-rich repeat flightless-interacting protein 2 [Halotydeus destructor]